jgi:RNA ligase (TIGR02306 family)
MSEFACPVVRVGAITKHPQADLLSITEIDGCPVIFKTEDFKEGDLAIYVPIESVVKQDSEGGRLMPWLEWKYNGTSRIKAKKLRGVFSMGVLVPAPQFKEYPEWVKFSLEATGGFFATAEEMATWKDIDPPEGTDAAAHLGIEKYVEPEHLDTRGQDEQAPQGFQIPVYDLENFRKYKGLFEPGEYVAITEKIHGCNARFAFLNGALQVGSHNRWKRRPPEGVVPGKSDVWWKLALQENLETRLNHPEVVDRYCFYGEVYGQVQDLKYGVPSGVKCVMFDILDLKTLKWLDYPEFLAVCGALNLETAPCLYTGVLDEAKAFELAEGLSELGEGKCIREGVVIRPLLERQDLRHGRVCLKLHGQGYLLRKGGTEAH